MQQRVVLGVLGHAVAVLCCAVSREQVLFGGPTGGVGRLVIQRWGTT